jgi:myosin heavy subunit
LAQQVSKTIPLKEQCKAVLNKIAPKSNDWQLGQTKVFLRERLEIEVERLRHSGLKAVVAKIAALILGYAQRKRYLLIRKRLILLQAVYVWILSGLISCSWVIPAHAIFICTDESFV